MEMGTAMPKGDARRGKVLGPWWRTRCEGVAICLEIENELPCRSSWMRDHWGPAPTKLAHLSRSCKCAVSDATESQRPGEGLIVSAEIRELSCF